MRSLRAVVPIALVGLAVAAPAPAFAQQSSVPGYNGTGGLVTDVAPGGGGGGEVAGRTASGDGVAGRSVGGGGEGAAQGNRSLPFTGADLGLIAGAGALLLGLGVGMRRLIRRPNAA